MGKIIKRTHAFFCAALFDVGAIVVAGLYLLLCRMHAHTMRQQQRVEKEHRAPLREKGSWRKQTNISVF